MVQSRAATGRHSRRRSAIVLRGAHAHTVSVFGRDWGPDDWRGCFHSLNASFIHPRRQQGWMVEVFYHTHHSNDSAALHKVYRPSNYSEERISPPTLMKSSLLPWQKITSDNTQWRSGLAALLTIRDPLRYDEILFTRFDLRYRESVHAWNLRPDHFNVPFRHPSHGEIADAFFVFNGSFVAPFIRLLRTHASFSMHAANLSFLSPVHFMVARRYHSDTDQPRLRPGNNNPLYTLVRTRRWGMSNGLLQKLQMQERSRWWMFWRIQHLVNSEGGGLIMLLVLLFGLHALICACMWVQRLREHGRGVCSFATVLANLIWLALPALFFYQLLLPVFKCEQEWCLRHATLDDFGS